jgi:5-(carboxyamino)imidazole ribonucleotide mutase
MLVIRVKCTKIPVITSPLPKNNLPLPSRTSGTGVSTINSFAAAFENLRHRSVESQLLCRCLREPQAPECRLSTPLPLPSRTSGTGVSTINSFAAAFENLRHRSVESHSNADSRLSTHFFYLCPQKAILNKHTMNPKVSIIMGSTSDLEVMSKAALILDEFEIPFEINALSAHRTPERVEEFARTAKERGIKVIIAGAGMAAHLPGVVAALTPIPVIGVPIKASLDGMDALLAIVQMPPGIPVATVAINGAQNAGLLAVQMIATGDEDTYQKFVAYKEGLKKKIIEANKDLAEVKFKFKVNS